MLSPIFDDIDISLFDEMTEEQILSYLECKYGSEGKEVNQLLIMTEYNFNRICEK